MARKQLATTPAAVGQTTNPSSEAVRRVMAYEA